MSQFGARREQGYSWASYQQSTAGDEDVNRQANQYNLDSYPAYSNPQDDATLEQQHAYYGTRYSDPAIHSRSWPEGANVYETSGQWGIHHTAYHLAEMVDITGYSNLHQGTDQYVHGNFPDPKFQGTEASGEGYGSEPLMGANTAGYHQLDVAESSAHMSYGRSSRSTMRYPQEHQAMHEEYSCPDAAPLLHVHAPPDDDRGGLGRSTSTSGYPEVSTFAYSNTAESSMLSPTYGLAEGHGEEASSEGSLSPDEQAPPSPSGAIGNADRGRKWRCKQAECAERQGFKRHADLMRHMSTVHHREDMGRFDCSKRTCPRRGENGFTRKDHLTEHLRNFHLQDIPKRRGGRGRNRE